MELGAAINKLADSVASSNGFVALLDNPFYMAVMLTVIIMIILFFSGFRPQAKASGEAAGAAQYVRSAFYVSCAIVAVIFVYHRRFQMCQMRTARVETIGSALANPATIGDTGGVPVIRPVFL